MSDASTPIRSPLGAFETAGATDVGQVRMANQDAFGEFVDEANQRHLLFVADGMGGHRGGEVASQITVDAVGEYFQGDANPPGEVVLGALQKANTCVHDRAEADRQLQGMGTTAVALLFDTSNEAWVAHVGDSRCYRMRDGVMTQLTDDHSVVGELVRRGQLTPEEARVHPQSNEILRAIGTQPDVTVDVAPVDVRPGDRYLLCSDGLSGMLTDDEIAEVFGSQPAEEAVHTLIARANAAGGTDNITVQIGIIGDRIGGHTSPAATHGSASAHTSAPAHAHAPEGESAAPRPAPPATHSAPVQKMDFGLLPWLVIAAAIALIIAWWLTG